MTDEPKEKPDFKKPATPEKKTWEKITAGVVANEEARKKPLLNADEVKKILEEDQDGQ